MPLPLDGVLVADFSRVLAGPLATSMLADLGARVIKVERPGTGDDTRSWGPPWAADGASYFHSANRNKESLTLDLADHRDRAVAQELARRADVVVENFRAGTLDRYDLGYEQVRAGNEGVVYCSISGFGSTGAGADLPGYDFLVQAVGGLMSVTGAASGSGAGPTKVGVALVDVLTSKDAAIGILASLIARTTTGKGQRVEANLLSSLLASLVNQASAFLTTGDSPRRMGNAHPSIAPYELLRCADGELAMACGNDGQFRKLAAATGDVSLADDERFATNASRVMNREVLVAELERRLADDTVDRWVDRFSSIGVPAGKVGSIEDGFALAQRLGLEPSVPVGEDVPAQVRNPLTFSETPITNYVAPPRLGQDSDDIRRWLHEERIR
ncbi:CoA transferase [Microbacterium sp. zg-B185]|nr:CoA transferase [Microbacterium sp. zg-B185]WIM19477.1 CoA transferase [Microbacterium sp. zg-B185]